jgi:hypothetical protein
MKLVDTSSSAEKTSLVAQIFAFVSANFLLVAVLALVGRCLYKKYASPLRNVPGPWLASVSRLWKGIFPADSHLDLCLSLMSAVWSTYNGHTELDHIALHKKYGTHPAIEISEGQVGLIDRANRTCRSHGAK